jgi:hydroxymethylbilane synthase
MRPLKIASRASKLALVQSSHVRNLLKNLCDGIEISIMKISTKGDRDKSDFLHKSDSRGFFTSEVENALLDGRADIAVHSLKDLPTACTEGLVVAAVPKRESVSLLCRPVQPWEHRAFDALRSCAGLEMT